MTQDGIATGLSLSRAHVALELKRLKTSGRVGERMAHVAHARSRRKVYDLTSSGQEIARKMRDHARSRTVQLNETGGLREVPGSEAIEALRRGGLRESDAIQHILAADVIEIPRPEGPKAPPPGRPTCPDASSRSTTCTRVPRPMRCCGPWSRTRSPRKSSSRRGSIRPSTNAPTCSAAGSSR